MNRIIKIAAVALLFTFTLMLFQKANAQMEFVENKGQWHKQVDFKGDFNYGSFFLENKGFTVLLHNTTDLAAVSELGHGSNKPVTLHSFAYKVNFLGASQGIKALPEKPMASHNNYFIGNDRSKWAGNCSIYQAVTYKNIYPNIDVRYYSDAGKLKYDFIVNPGGNVSAIAMQFAGPELVIKDKELIVKTTVGDIKELYPYSYQTGKEARKEIDCKYVVRNNVVTFNIKEYNPREVLIIDPSIIFSTFTKSTADNWGYTATPGPDGSLYAGGIVFADPPSTGYPVSSGAFQTSYGGGATEDGFPGYDIGIFKFSPDGSNRIYATYLGGSANEQPHSMIVDKQGNLIVAGRTFSPNYPTTNRVGAGGGFDIVITKFNNTGSNIIGSVRIGGTGDDGVNITPKYHYQGDSSIRRNYGDDARSEVILDGSNNIILASCTQSPDFPTNGPSLNTNGLFGGRQDGLVLKFNPDLSTYLYGSFFGGNGNDACFVASISPTTGYLYVGGATSSTNLPGDKTGVLHGSYQGNLADGFVSKIKIDSGIVRTTYTGTSGIDLVYGLKFDRKGFPYIMGTTTGSWPVSAGVFSNPNSSQFISKLQPDLSGFVYSTVFGDGNLVPNISPIAFLVDRCENVYVSGWGGGLNVRFGYTSGTTLHLPEVNPLPNIPAPDGADFYFFVLQKNGISQLFGSHFGQNGGLGDHVDGGTSRFDENGVIYQALCANCGNDVTFPTTPSAWSRTNGSQGCNEALVKIKMDFAGVAAGLQTSIDGVVNDTTGCVPFKVVFKDTLFLGTKFYWDFGDNSPQVVTTTPDTSHVYTATGRYIVRLIAEDLNTCNQRDTAYITIKAGDNRANLALRAVKDTPCTSTAYTFYNLSGSTFPVSGGFTAQSFTWDYGDGSAPETSFNGRHVYPGVGEYHVKLTLTDTNYCNSPADTTIILRVYDLVKASFTTPLRGCAPYNALFKFNSGGAGTDFFWSFGDGTFSTDSTQANPTHLYEHPGVYPVRLIVRDTNTCNKVDTSAYFNVTVLPKPVAAFTWSPNPPQRNTATQFTNLSTGAVRYLWDFGEEGETSTEENPKHQFNSTGSFRVTLTAFNQNDCDSTVSMVVTATVDPLLDVPNAFTPGKFGMNGYVAVRGYGIGKMDWRIYNRWGQLVFHTSSRKESWDGMFKGKLQPMDVYSYTLDVEFTDGKKLRKTGDITLLR